MAETQRLSAWGWFVRAFAGGVGAMFGVMAALMFACVACYVIFAVGATAFSSFGLVRFEQPMVLGGAASNSAVESSPLTAIYNDAQPYTNPYGVESLPAAYAEGTPAAASYEPAPARFITPPLTEAE